jgi:anti-sigma-K factor RskA
MAAKPVDLTCDEVEELAGAYSLDALPEDEERAVEAHLDVCANSHDALRDLGETAALLAFTVPSEEPPAALGRRIMDAVVAGDSGRGSRDNSVVVHREDSHAILPFGRSTTRTSLLFPALAAAFALLAIGLGWWGVSQHQALTSARATASDDGAVLAAITSGSALVQTPAVGALKPALLIQPPDGKPAYLLLNWPRAGNGKTYQAWLVSAGQKPTSAGVFDGGTGAFSIVHLVHPLTGAQAFAVTLEPSGGSDQPTTQPFVIRTLQS